MGFGCHGIYMGKADRWGKIAPSTHKVTRDGGISKWLKETSALPPFNLERTTFLPRARGSIRAKFILKSHPVPRRTKDGGIQKGQACAEKSTQISG